MSSCNCNNPWHDEWCPSFLPPAQPCSGGEACEEQVSTDCIIYTGPNIPCYGVTTGMTITEVLDILYQALYPTCITTTLTPPTTTTTTLAPCTICTGLAALPTIYCLIGLKIEFLYIASIGDLSRLPFGYIHPCPTSIGVHNCNRSLHEVFMAGHYIGDALMNNDDGVCGSITEFGTPICKDYKNTPAPLMTNGVWGGTEHSRYNSIVLSVEEAMEIAQANGGSSTISFVLDHAVTKYGVSCDGSQSPHDHKIWVRISTANGTVIYNQCHQDGAFTLDVCAPPPSTTTTSTSTTTTTTAAPCPTCNTYRVNNTGSNVYVTYKTCPSGLWNTVLVSGSSTTDICACTGSVIAPTGPTLTITNLGACATTTTTTSLPTTSTTSTSTTTTLGPGPYAYSSIYALTGPNCGASGTLTNRWATTSPATIGTYLYQTFGMTSPVADGWYYSPTLNKTLQVTGGLGLVTAEVICP